MTDPELVAFLAEVAPRLGLRTSPYRRLGGTLKKRLRRRLRELGVQSLLQYRLYLDAHSEEWTWLDASCRVTISRFGRDAATFSALIQRHLPERAAAALGAGRSSLRVHCAGCASGEEPYSLAIAYRSLIAPRYPELALDVIGTDIDPRLLARAERATYAWGAVRELPEDLRAAAFVAEGDALVLKADFREGVRFELMDLRRELPAGPFDLITCRNVAFTYFDEPLQRRLAEAFAAGLVAGGLLVIGKGEALPASAAHLGALHPQIYRRLQVDAPLRLG